MARPLIGPDYPHPSRVMEWGITFQLLGGLALIGGVAWRLYRHVHPAPLLGSLVDDLDDILFQRWTEAALVPYTIGYVITLTRYIRHKTEATPIERTLLLTPWVIGSIAFVSIGAVALLQ